MRRPRWLAKAPSVMTLAEREVLWPQQRNVPSTDGAQLLRGASRALVQFLVLDKRHGGMGERVLRGAGRDGSAGHELLELLWGHDLSWFQQIAQWHAVVKCALLPPGAAMAGEIATGRCGAELPFGRVSGPESTEYPRLGFEVQAILPVVVRPRKLHRPRKLQRLAPLSMEMGILVELKKHPPVIGKIPVACGENPV